MNFNKIRPVVSDKKIFLSFLYAVKRVLKDHPREV